MSAKQTSSGGKGQVGSRFTAARISVMAVAIVAVVFIFENTRQVKIRLLIPEVTMPLCLALLAMFLIGVVCGACFLRRRAK